MKLAIFLLFPLFLSAQLNRAKGEVFKHRPEYPYEDVKKNGQIVVKKGMYGLVFEDKYLSQEAKNKIQTFFNRRYSGYTTLKTYTLKIENTPKGWCVEGYFIQ